MELADFEMLVALAETTSVTRAAERLGRTQPAVSVRLKRLSAELGTTLVETSGPGLRFTAAGEVLLGRARRVLDSVREAREAVDEIQGLLRGRVTVGASTTPGHFLVPDALTLFQRSHPGIELVLRIGNTLAIERAILDSELDLGVVGGHLESREVETRDLVEDRLVPFAAAAHPLAQAEEIGLEELVAYPFVRREPGSATQALLERFLRERGLRMQSQLEVGSPDALKRAVAAGAGIGVLSHSALRWETEDGRLSELTVRDFTLTRTLLLVTRKGRELSRATQALVRELQASVARA